MGCKISKEDFFFLSRVLFSFFFLFACRMVRGHEEVSTSQAGRRRGTPWETLTTSSVVSFIAGYWMFKTIAISYIPSKFEVFFYLGPQLIIFTLQEFNTSL